MGFCGRIIHHCKACVLVKLHPISVLCVFTAYFIVKSRDLFKLQI